MNATPFRSPRHDARELTVPNGTTTPIEGTVDEPSEVAGPAAGAETATGHPAVRRILARHAGDRDGSSEPPPTASVPSTSSRTPTRATATSSTSPTAQALRRVAGLSTELEDVTEVEYRQLRLERVVLAGLWTSGSAADAENSLHELAALAETAGSVVLDGVLQRRENPDPATFLGSGKAQDLRDVVAATGADTVICDGELSPSQRRGLEDVVKVKVIDRTALILDIFAQHAKSKEGKAQVELAQLDYLLPRLRGWGESMSRQAGGRVAGGAGIGSRGPGETKIELDRRRIRTRMAKLRRDISHMKTSRVTKRDARRRNSVPSVAIVGYTNAGKSSLLNRLTGAGVLVEDALFATLDPTVRRARVPDGREFTLTDTVGFVRQLPHQLVEAFRSTLEEVAGADLVLHVVDGSPPRSRGAARRRPRGARRGGRGLRPRDRRGQQGRRGRRGRRPAPAAHPAGSDRRLGPHRCRDRRPGGAAGRAAAAATGRDRRGRALPARRPGAQGAH